jgi:hypothetical protein
MEQIPRIIERKRNNGMRNCMNKEQKIFKQRYMMENDNDNMAKDLLLELL